MKIVLIYYLQKYLPAMCSRKKNFHTQTLHSVKINPRNTIFLTLQDPPSQVIEWIKNEYMWKHSIFPISYTHAHTHTVFC